MRGRGAVSETRRDVVDDLRMVRLFDTTLRDGEQAPGFGLDPAQKLRFARQQVALGVDVIEAGFAASSPAEAEAISAIARDLGRDCVIASMARASTVDVDVAAGALSITPDFRIHTFVPVSDLHIDCKLGSSRAAVLDAAVVAIRRALEHTDDVQLGLEDATRADREFLTDVVREGVRAGATTVTVADTVGYIVPDEMTALVEALRTVEGMDEVTLSVHCHDDLGLAVANSLAALVAGAGQVECTVNGIGERAGNASLEEIVMLLRTRRQVLGLDTVVHTPELTASSRLLAELTGIGVQPNKAIVGANVFAHEAGIHQQGVLANPLTYEILTPESVGADGRALVLGHRSGWRAVQQVLADRNIAVSEEESRELAARLRAGDAELALMLNSATSTRA